MTRPVLAQRAQKIPGSCVLSGTNKGPFIDTQRELRGYGRLYLAIAAIAPVLREAGWIQPDDLESLREDAAAGGEYWAELEVLKEQLARIRKAVGPDTVEVRTSVKVEVPRDPTDEEIEAYLKRQVKRAQHSPQHRTPAPERPESEKTTIQDHLPTAAPPQYFDLHDQKLDLDELLNHSIPTIQEVITDNERTGLVQAIIARETWRANHNGNTPRKGILTLGGDDE